MRIDWKVSAISASAAFLLSALVGIIGSVSFGALLLRAVIGAAVFGAGAIAVSVLIDRFLPDLKAAVMPASSEKSGGKVDIVVEGDESDVLMSVGVGEEIGEGDESGSAEDAMGEPTEVSVAEDASADELSEVDESDVSSLDDLPTPGDGEGSETGSEAIEELAAAGNLPDVEGFADSFSEIPTESVSSIDSGANPADDPAILAKAIRTVLKRDE